MLTKYKGPTMTKNTYRTLYNLYLSRGYLPSVARCRAKCELMDLKG